MTVSWTTLLLKYELLESKSARLPTTFIVQDFLEKNKMATIPHPPYSPDLAPSDFFLFPKMKINLKGRRFQTVEEIQAKSQKVLNKLSKKGLPDGIQYLEEALGAVYTHKGTISKGKGLFAVKPIKAGDVIFEERPLVCCQFAWNAAYGYLACDFCMRNIATKERLGGKSPDVLTVDKIDRVTKYYRGAIYDNVRHRGKMKRSIYAILHHCRSTDQVPRHTKCPVATSDPDVENVVEVQRRRVEFGTQPPTRLTITKVRDKFEVDETVQDVLKGHCGRKRSSTDNESVDAVIQAFAQSPKKSMRWGSSSLSCQCEEFSRSHTQSEKDRMKRKCCGVPASISGLIPPDFYVWGALKDTVYATKPQRLEELRVQIEHACNDIPLATIQLVQYCSITCRDQAWNQYHKTLCLQKFSLNLSHPLEQLNEAWKHMHYPPETASIMILARMIATVRQADDPSSALNLFMQFCHQTVNEEEEIAHKLLGEQFVGQLQVLRELVSQALYSDAVQQWLTPDGFQSLFALVGTNGQGVGTSPFSEWVKKVSELELASDDKQQLDSFIDKVYEDLDEEAGGFLNSEGSALYSLQSACNHSCDPNAMPTFPHSNFQLVMTAVKDIVPGEEILISYLDECALERSRHSRHKILRENYLFTCHCSKCEAQAGDPDETSEDESDYDEDQEVEREGKTVEIGEKCER
ncbi:hypothetical protein ANN_02851 [Periplaneta americana]|uniref:Protein-lysine N-trimethyltransferase SMYD5 n=1 Tax=Periplaneta americana TaxID=6978 RepID=A0ABQ8TXG2_PERAM|nr:hypothetical protein ANN_02851 [Periplaneta americana]